MAQIQLSWNAVAGATDYRVFRTTNGTFGTTPIADRHDTRLSEHRPDKRHDVFVSRRRAQRRRRRSVLGRRQRRAGRHTERADQHQRNGWKRNGHAVVDGDRERDDLQRLSQHDHQRSGQPAARDGCEHACVRGQPVDERHGLLLQGHRGQRVWRRDAVDRGHAPPRWRRRTAPTTATAATTGDPALSSTFRFLRQATWGPRPGDIERVRATRHRRILRSNSWVRRVRNIPPRSSPSRSRPRRNSSWRLP